MEKRKVVMGCGDTIYLGKQGENLAREITFTDPLEWAELFGPGVAQLVNMRPDDTAPYPVELTMQDGCAVWAVTASDTGKVGRGSCELRYYVGDVLAKSRTWSTIVEASISDELTEPPEPQKGWVDKVLQVGADMEDAAKRVEGAAVRQPYPNAETGTWWVWNADAEAYQDTGISYGGSGGGTTDHSKLSNRNAADQHPMSAITGLEKTLEGKQPSGSYLTDKDLDATLKEEGKAADAKAVGDALSSLSEDITSQVATHNTGTDTHSDIRLLIQGLTNRLNALADSDDTTLDQLSEVVAYIKSNRELISAITTDKVSVADIIDNLTTNVANKPLSAAQGVALKALIDAITIPEKLPNPNALTFTGAASGTYDGSEALEVVIPSGGGGEVNADMELLGEIDCSEVSGNIVFTGLNNLTEVYIISEAVQNSNESTESGYAIEINDILITKNQAVTISKSGTTSYGWLYLRYNGCVWLPVRSAGAIVSNNFQLTSSNANMPYNHVIGVGKAQGLRLISPVSQYQAVSGTIKIYGR